MSEAVYTFHFGCYRMGTLYGLFIADKKEMEDLVASEKEIYFGEVLGKHSEIIGKITEDDYTLISDDPATVEFCKRNKLEIGFNPVKRFKELK